ncbi:MAG: glycine cleavage system protein H [Anaerolineae bacterium]|nr:glycine cleavage system protein H [Anaerolineae bacterium]
MNPDSYIFTVDKFTFTIPTDRLYSTDGLWVRQEGHHFWVGISDYLQRRSGDIAFAEVKPEGSVVRGGDELAAVETIKVTISLPAPIPGKVIQVNPMMGSHPEIINENPYGEGWLVLMESLDEEPILESLLEPLAYYQKVKREAEQEAGKA